MWWCERGGVWCEGSEGGYIDDVRVSSMLVTCYKR